MRTGKLAQSAAILERGLYLVSTPIGNLEDITLRALRVLDSCALVAAEDTRRIRKLLNHFDIKVKTVSYREQNRSRVIPRMLDEIRKGSAVALVSDAGTPCLSDPGAELVAACTDEGLRVFAVPGPSAVACAVALSGMPVDMFTFVGFPPSRPGRRKKLFASLSERPEPLVLFEAPHRIERTLEDLAMTLGDRKVVIMREMTKLHEERIIGSLTELRSLLSKREKILGEFTLVVEGAGEAEARALGNEELRRRYLLLIAEGAEPIRAVKLLAGATGTSKRELYRLLRRSKHNGEQQ